MRCVFLLIWNVFLQYVLNIIFSFHSSDTRTPYTNKVPIRVGTHGASFGEWGGGRVCDGTFDLSVKNWPSINATMCRIHIWYYIINSFIIFTHLHLFAYLHIILHVTIFFLKTTWWNVKIIANQITLAHQEKKMSVFVLGPNFQFVPKLIVVMLGKSSCAHQSPYFKIIVHYVYKLPTLYHICVKVSRFTHELQNGL